MTDIAKWRKDNIKSRVKRSIEISNLKKNHKETLETKNTVTEMKTIFYGVIRTLDMTRGRISELENGNLQN